MPFPACYLSWGFCGFILSTPTISIGKVADIQLLKLHLHCGPMCHSQSSFNHNPLTLKCHTPSGTAITKSILNLPSCHLAKRQLCGGLGPCSLLGATDLSKIQMGAVPESSTVLQKISQSLVCYTCCMHRRSLCHFPLLIALSLLFTLTHIFPVDSCFCV